MSDHNQNCPHNPSHKTHRLRKKILGVISRGLSTGGWLAFTHYLWVDYQADMIALAVIILFVGPLLEVLTISLSKKRLGILAFAWTLSNVGWLSLCYFTWFLINPVGIVISLIIVFSGDAVDIFIL